MVSFVDSNDDLLTLKDVKETSKPRSRYSHAFIQGIRIKPQVESSVAETPESDSSSGEPSTSEFQSIFGQVGFQLEEDEIYHWLESDLNDPGVQRLSDSEICDLVSEETEPDLDSEDKDEPQAAIVSNSEAAFMFEQFLSWLEHQPEANVYNTTCLRQLHALAAEKKVNSFKLEYSSVC